MVNLKESGPVLKAVILAAGLGSRLAPLTNETPKPLIEVLTKPILQSQLEALGNIGVSDVAVICGHLGDKIAAWTLETTLQNKPKLTLIRNKDYETTNNMFSLSLAQEFVGNDPFFLLNGDVFHMDEGTLAGFDLNDGWVQIAGLRGVHYQDAMKLHVDDQGLVTRLNKDPSDESWGISLDTYFFGRKGSHLLFQEIANHLQTKGMNDWTEVAIQSLLKSEERGMKMVDSKPSLIEIDTHEDLLLATEAAGSLALGSLLKGISLDRLRLIVDIDGTLVTGGQIHARTLTALSRATDSGVSLLFVSNNTSMTLPDLSSKLSALGLVHDSSQIITPLVQLENFLRVRRLNSLNVCASQTVTQHLASLGFDMTSDEPDAHVLGYNPQVTYESLCNFSEKLHLGTGIYIATHGDKSFPAKSGPWPDAGAFIELFNATVDRRPDYVLGKPSPQIISGIPKLGIDLQIVVGDRLETDIRLANSAALPSALVLTGSTKLIDYTTARGKKDVPDFVFADLAAFLETLLRC